LFLPGVTELVYREAFPPQTASNGIGLNSKRGEDIGVEE